MALCPAARADQAAVNDLTTAFAYNFIVLSTWPAESPLVLRFCVAGAPEAAVPFRVLADKPVRERTLSVSSVPSPERAADCHILYIPPAQSVRLEAWLAAVAKQPTLTISDQAGGPGAMVNLRLAGGRIVFDIDTRAAAAARIGLSSQLIKLGASRQ